MQFVRIWQLRVSLDKVPEFRAAYGPDGAWVKLFRNAPGFRGTELIQSTDDASKYLTIDRWESAAAWGAFLDAWRDEYHELDRECETLTTSETEIGSFLVA